MSPTHKFMVTLVSAGLIATIALATGILEMFYKILNLSEETRSLLQGVAVAGQILLLVAQSIESSSAGAAEGVGWLLPVSISNMRQRQQDM